MTETTTRVEMRLLGGAALRVDGSDRGDLVGQPKRFALLAYLTLAEPTGFHRRDSLLTLFWPASDEQRARSALRTSLHFLRGALPPGTIRTRGQDTIGVDRSIIWCDAAAFQDHLEHERWKEAAALYRGHLLPGYSVPGAAPCEDWLDLSRARLARRAGRAFSELAAALTAAGDNAGAIDTLGRWAELEPYQEGPVIRLMQALAGAGERVAAIERGEAFVSRIDREMDGSPGPDLVALLDDLKRRQLVSPPRRSADRPRGTGADDVESDVSSAGVRGEPWTFAVPHPATPLIGRDAEVTAVLGALMKSSVRLLTLTGPGGIGKTRLALAMAVEAGAHLPHGACFVDLAPVTHEAMVLPAIAAALGIREAGPMSFREELIIRLRERRMLLILDNFEHVLGAAGELNPLLEAASGLKLLITSREPLRLRAEHEHPVPPLGRYPATELFAARARAVLPQFDLDGRNAGAVGEICARLDHLPLAIELAAARVKLFPPQQILERLDHRLALLTGGPRDLPARHQTLRAAIEWSYDLLCEEERRLFRRLSVFSGGFTFDAAAAVCFDPGDDGQEELIDRLASLVDKSLLHRRPDQDGRARFGMLETIQEYARERLFEANESVEVSRRHAAFYVAMAEMARAEVQSPRQAGWLVKLEEEHDNLRTALRGLVERRDVKPAVALAGALRWFWYTGGHLSEGREWLARVLELAAGGSDSARADILYTAAALALRQIDYAAARAYASESLTIFRRLGDSTWTARALNVLGNVAKQRGELEEALPLYRESLDLLKRAGDDSGVAVALCNLGSIAHEQKDLSSARGYYEEGLALARRSGDGVLLSEILGNLGTLVHQEGDLRSAGGFFRDSLRAASGAGHRYIVAWILGNLAAVASDLGQPFRAARLFGAGESLFTLLGTHLPPSARGDWDRDLETARSLVADAEWRSAWAEGEAMSLREAIEYGLQE